MGSAASSMVPLLTAPLSCRCQIKMRVPSMDASPRIHAGLPPEEHYSTPVTLA